MNTLTQRPWALLLSCVALSAIAQLLLKYGMSRGAAPAGIGGDPRALLMLLLKPPVLVGLVIYAVSVVLWLLVLSKVDVSQAYPFVGAGFLITMVGGAVFFGESITLARLGGTLLIGVGLVLVARS